MAGQSLCGEGRVNRIHYYQLSRPTAVAKLWTVTADTADHQVQLVNSLILGMLEICASTERSTGPSLHPVQALKNHLQLICGSMILDHIGTRFLGGDLYAAATYTRVYMVTPDKVDRLYRNSCVRVC